MLLNKVPINRASKRQSGFTILEVGIASVLVAMLGSSVLMFIADELRTSEAQSAGLALTALNTAVSEYEAQFAINLTNHTAVPIPGYANVANPYAPTTTELYELGFLKTPVPTGVYGVTISQPVQNGTPSGMVWLIKPFTDNLNQPSMALAGAAMIAAGGDAAFSTVASPGVVEGADGWTATNPQTNTAAVLAMRNGAGSAAYVRLDGSTPMQGSESFNGYNLTNAGTVSAATVNAQTVAASGNTSGATLTATAEGNDVFFGSSALYSDGWNTVIRNTGGALYVQNFSGTAEPVVASQFIAPAGNGVQIGSSYYYGDSWNSAIRQNGTLYVQNQAGSGAANVDANRLTAEEYVQVNGWAAVGWGCSPSGLLGQDGSGKVLNCVNGVWQNLGGGSGPYNGEMYGVSTGYGGCYTLPPYGQWAVYIGSISYWPPSGTSGAGGVYASGVYSGGAGWCAQKNGGSMDQLMGYAWRIS